MSEFLDIVGHWCTGIQIQPDEPFTEPEPEGVKLHVTHVCKPFEFVDLYLGSCNMIMILSICTGECNIMNGASFILCRSAINTLPVLSAPTKCLAGRFCHSMCYL